ncbi:MAG: Cys-tRNA(Pro) deacylase [Gemmataceae bacterium]
MTPAVRLLEREGVPFTPHPYEHDPDAGSFGEEAAAKLGVPAERVFKTLVCDADGLVLVLVPSSARLSVKALARARGVKKADLADPEKAERATGYVVGGISPLAGRKRLPALIDESVTGHRTVFVSAGVRGLQLELSPDDLVRLTGAELAALT